MTNVCGSKLSKVIIKLFETIEFILTLANKQNATFVIIGTNFNAIIITYQT